MVRVARRRRTIASSTMLLLALVSAACARQVSPPVARVPAVIDTMALREHTRVLAHDSLRGRGTGTPGARSAARYIAEQLRELGLEPLDGQSASSAQDYLLPVPLLRSDISAATLSVDDRTLTNGDGFIVGRVGRAGLRAAAGPVARFAGDSADVTPGAWLLLDSSPGEAALRWLPVWSARGVAGLIVRLSGDAAVAGWHAQLGDVRWQLEQGEPDPVWQPALPIVLVGPALAAVLEEPGVRVAFEPNARTTRVTDFNVVGVLPGDRPDLAPVFLTAHYDHLGVRPGAGDGIYNGFSDNAAGVAMLLAIARSASPAPPPRPLVFLFTAAEEVGLLGSLHFVRTHAGLVDRTHALVNLDAGAPPAAPTRWRLAGATRSSAGPVAAAVVESSGAAHRSDAGSPNSDHWPFMARGVPSIFLIPDGGFEGLSEAQARSLVERWDRYHHPDDEWAADFPFAGLQRYATLGREIAYALARAELPR